MKAEILKETVSAKGYQVTLAKECGSYFGARPYYTVSRGAKVGQTTKNPTRRHTPFLPRAEALYRAFAQDVTDPQRLAELQP